MRLPVTWGNFMGSTPPYTVSATLFNRLATVIGWANKRGMPVILNAHHEGWFKADPIGQAARFDALWSQIATRFKDIPNAMLVFEILNESEKEHIDDAQTDQMNSRITGIIRQTNPQRCVIIGPVGDNAPRLRNNQMAVINDPYIVATSHTYDPWSFCSGQTCCWGSDSDKNYALNGEPNFNSLKSWSDAHNCPVNIGEFGVTAVGTDPGSRATWIGFFCQAAITRGLSYDIWDDGGAMQFLDRSTWTWTPSGILNAIFPVPALPTALEATNVTTTGFTASWITLGTNTCNGYYLDVSTSSSFSSYVPGYQNLQVVGPTKSSLVVTGLSGNTMYYYRLRGYSGGGSSANSLTISAKTGALDSNGRPVPPGDLTATPGPTQVVLTWSACYTATNYYIKSSATIGGPYTTIVTTVGTRCTNAGLTIGNTYYYVVSGINTNGEGSNSAPASATTGFSRYLTVGPATGVWVNDGSYSPGGATASTTTAIDTSLLTAPVPPQSVLQNERYGSPLTYTVAGATPDMACKVTLYFTENYWTAAGQRQMNVSINGTRVLTGLDIYATAGAQFKAVQRSFTTTADGSGNITIQITNTSPAVDQAKMDGIAVMAASACTNTNTITARAGANGSINPNAAVSVSCGNNQAFTITPNSNYHIANVLVDSASVGAVSSYTFTNVTADHTISASFSAAAGVNLQLDFTLSGGTYATGWNPTSPADESAQDFKYHNIAVNNIGGSGYNFTLPNVCVYDNTAMAGQPLTRAGVFNVGWNWGTPDATARTFTLLGLTVGKSVKLYACAGWDGNAKGAVIVYGGSTVQAQTVGDPGTSPTLANLTLIGTATADGSGKVSGTLNGASGVGSASEGQVGGMVFVLPSPATPFNITATASGSSIHLSFPTITGMTYQVQYATQVSPITWQTNSTVVGDDTVKSVSEPIGATQRFYRVVAGS